MPDINNFPNEVMVETFTYLDLGSLTKCMRVNKSFKAITEHSAFDKIFFRTKAIQPGDPINHDKLQINPALNELSYTCRSSIKEARLLRCYTKPDGKDDRQPAVTRIYLRPYGYDGVMVKSEDALTVQDVMEGLCNYYKSGRSYDRCHYFFEGFYKAEQSSTDILVLEAHWGS
ncbi:hypothetical protein KCU83_g5004, partial [Aureobasidium melanogenum]